MVIYGITIGLCSFGCVTRLLLALYYRGLQQAVRGMKSSRSRTVRALREQFIVRYQALLGVENVNSFVGRFFAQQRLCGIPLAWWNGLHAQLAAACLLIGAIASFYGVMQGAELEEVLGLLFQGILTSTLLLFVDGLCMVTGRAEGVRESFCDYLENYLKVRLEHEYTVWGKYEKDDKLSKAALEAQLLVADEREYRKRKQEERKRLAEEQKLLRKKEEEEARQVKKQEEEERRLQRQQELEEARLHFEQERQWRAAEAEAKKKEEARRKLAKKRFKQEGDILYRGAKQPALQQKRKSETELLKQELREQRRREAEAAAAREQEEREQVEEILKEFISG